MLSVIFPIGMISTTTWTLKNWKRTLTTPFACIQTWNSCVKFWFFSRAKPKRFILCPQICQWLQCNVRICDVEHVFVHFIEHMQLGLGTYDASSWVFRNSMCIFISEISLKYAKFALLLFHTVAQKVGHFFDDIGICAIITLGCVVICNCFCHLWIWWAINHAICRVQWNHFAMPMVHISNWNATNPANSHCEYSTAGLYRKLRKYWMYARFI